MKFWKTSKMWNCEVQWHLRPEGEFKVYKKFGGLLLSIGYHSKIEIKIFEIR